MQLALKYLVTQFSLSHLTRSGISGMPIERCRNGLIEKENHSVPEYLPEKSIEASKSAIRDSNIMFLWLEPKVPPANRFLKAQGCQPLKCSNLLWLYVNAYRNTREIWLCSQFNRSSVLVLLRVGLNKLTRWLHDCEERALGELELPINDVIMRDFNATLIRMIINLIGASLFWL